MKVNTIMTYFITKVFLCRTALCFDNRCVLSTVPRLQHCFKSKWLHLNMGKEVKISVAVICITGIHLLKFTATKNSVEDPHRGIPQNLDVVVALDSLRLLLNEKGESIDKPVLLLLPHETNKRVYRMLSVVLTEVQE